MTATWHRPTAGSPTPITFILAGNKLITLRYASRTPSRSSPRAAATMRLPNRRDGGADRTDATIVDHMALHRAQGEVEQLSHSIFEMKGGTATRQRRFDVMLKSIGREGELTSLAREHALSDACSPFSTQATNERKEDKLLEAHMHSTRDVASLPEIASTFLAGNIIFLLDATLGMINIQQTSRHASPRWCLTKLWSPRPTA